MHGRDKSKSTKHIETFILVILWLAVLLTPVIIQSDQDSINWQEIKGYWIRILPFLILSLFNHFILVPYLFFKNKKLWYLLSVLITILVFSLSLSVFVKQRAPGPEPPPLEQGSMRPPDTRPPRRGDRPARGRPLPPGQGPLQPLLAPRALPPIINSLLIALLIIGFDTGLRTAFKWNKSEKERLKLERENINNQLAMLRNQVNPHFFMNTLNNIHALIDLNTTEAKEAIIRLSHLMRHLLYDSNAELSPLAKEVTFIQSYIDLMKLRYSEKVKITFQFPNELPNKEIPPLLFTSLLENAFKHGISYSVESFVHIVLATTADQLTFTINNSKVPDQTDVSESGIGIENTRKRLNLIYDNDYDLDIRDSENDFSVQLIIPL